MKIIRQKCCEIDGRKFRLILVDTDHIEVRLSIYVDDDVTTFRYLGVHAMRDAMAEILSYSEIDPEDM